MSTRENILLIARTPLANHTCMGESSKIQNPELSKFNLKKCCIPTKLKKNLNGQLTLDELK